MKFNYNAHFEVSSSEVKDLVLGLAKGFVKVQEWKREQDEKETKKKTQMDRRMQPIAKKFREDFKRDMDRFDANRKRDMDAFNKRHQKNLKRIREFSDRIDKKIAYVNSKCKDSDIDVSTLPDDIKRQIALDYLKNHPLSEEQQKQVADEYIRKYGVIK